MDRNGNFDYRNLFYPGPAPLPVQIYPVNGDPRFPFHFPSGAPNMARNGSASPSAHEDIAADEASLDQPASASPSTGGGMVAKRDAAAAAQAASSPPVKLDHVVQGLSHLLREAIAFCEECLKMHKDVLAVAVFAGHATRNSLWRELLESRFDGSGVHKDLLHTLMPRVRRYTQQAQQAARDDPAGRSEEEEGSDKDAHYRLTLMAEKLSAQCKWIDQANRRALGSSAACEAMVGLMKEMMELCGKIVPGAEGAAQDGQEGGDRQY